MNLKISSLFPPKILVALTLLTPYVFILHYGVSMLELFVSMFLILVLLPTLIRYDLRLPRFLLVFYFLFTLGYVGALLNGVSWRVPIGIWNLNFFYKMILGIAAFCVGMRYKGEISALFRSKFVLATILVLTAIALIYPFLPFDTKIAYFGIFYPPDTDIGKYFTSRRLPGLGVNANIYAFMVYSYFLFSFTAFLNKKISFVIPLLSFLVILVLSSKLVIALALGSCIALLFSKSFQFSVKDIKRSIHVRIGKRAFLVGATLLMMLISIIIYATQTSTGKRIVDSYATVQRFEAILEKRSADETPVGFELRVWYWKKGLERVEMAPVLGIAKDPFLSLSGTLVGFYNPHNEFLRLWILYGALGLAAWVYLLAYLSYVNARNKTGLEWLILYGALAMFMVFDGGFDNPRINVYLLFLFGLNWSQIRRAKRERVVTYDRANRFPEAAIPA